MDREVEEPSVDERGDEHHPAFGLIGASRGSIAGGPNGGAHLFDSDVIHHHTVRIRIKAAYRKRDLHHDWIFGGKEFIEVELSEAQWASFVSSMNSGDGVPCTIRYIDNVPTPEFPYDPRLAYSMQETKDAAKEAYRAIKEARDAYEALDPKTPAKVKREAYNRLHYAIENATSGVTFAGKVLIEQTENVVTKARADIEAFVVNKAHQLGLNPGDIGAIPPMLDRGDEPQATPAIPSFYPSDQEKQ